MSSLAALSILLLQQVLCQHLHRHRVVDQVLAQRARRVGVQLLLGLHDNLEDGLLLVHRQFVVMLFKQELLLLRTELSQLLLDLAKVLHDLGLVLVLGQLLRDLLLDHVDQLLVVGGRLPCLLLDLLALLHHLHVLLLRQKLVHVLLLLLWRHVLHELEEVLQLELTLR